MHKAVTTFLAALMTFGAAFLPAQAQQYPGYGYNNNPYNNGGYGCGQNRRYQRRDRDDRRDGDNDRDDRDRDRDRGERRWNGSGAGYNAYGNCTTYGGQNSVVRGAIVGVNGNQVTLQTSNYTTLTIDDQPALDNRASGRVAIGRLVTAYGYWNGGVFYATQLV